MKRIVIYLAALIVSTSCSEKIGPKPGYRIIELDAAIAQPTSSKTTLDGEMVLWVAGDEIKVFDEFGNEAILKAQGGGEKTVFKGEAENFGSVIHAFYPASKFKNYRTADNTITLTLDKTYSTVGDIHLNPSHAVNEGQKTLIFKNICGVLQISIENTLEGMFIDFPNTVEIEAIGGNAISGDFTVDVLNNEISSIKSSSLSSKSIMGGFDRSEDVWDLYYIVPPGAFDNGMKFSVTSYNGIKSSFEVSKEIKVGQSQITPMPKLFWKEAGDMDEEEHGAISFGY